MDSLRLAAQAGDTNELYLIIRQYPDVLRCINDDDDQLIVETPLHIALWRGHVSFAMALIYLKPSWGRKLNHELRSPMHLAVLHGHNELVLALLAVDKDLARVKGSYGFTALHYAARTGNLEMLAHLLKECPECLEDLTIQHETALHVAAQEGQLAALKILARYIRRVHMYCRVEKRHLLNHKDREGNTVLHIAASHTQLEMIRVLLECEVDKNEINNTGLTALDLLMQSSETPNREESLHILRNPPKLNFFHRWDWIQRSELLAEMLKCEITGLEVLLTELTTRLRYLVGRGSIPSDQINALLVVLALILAATYQVMINPPGGVWQGSYSANTTSAETHVGESVMTSPFFRQFFTLNLIVFIMSSLITVVLLQTVSRVKIFVVLSLALLSLLLECVLLARQVIEPSNNPMSLSTKDQAKIQISAFMLVYIVMGIEFVRLLCYYSNPPIVRFFWTFFRDLVHKSC